jgi:hypothetical protein
MRRPGYFLIAIALFALVSGCNKKPAEEVKTTTKALPAGWSKVSNAKAGMSLSVPPGWKAFDLSSADIGKMLDELGKTDQNMARMGAQVKQLAASGLYKMFVIHSEASGDKVQFADNINIVSQDAPGKTLDAITEESKKGIAMATGGSDAGVTVKSDKIAGQDCRILHCNTKLQTATGTVPLDLTSYHFMRGSEVVVVTCTTPQSRIDKLDPVFKSIVNTLELK